MCLQRKMHRGCFKWCAIIGIFSNNGAGMGLLPVKSSKHDSYQLPELYSAQIGKWFPLYTFIVYKFRLM